MGVAEPPNVPAGASFSSATTLDREIGTAKNRWALAVLPAPNATCIPELPATTDSALSASQGATAARNTILRLASTVHRKNAAGPTNIAIDHATACGWREFALKRANFVILDWHNINYDRSLQSLQYIANYFNCLYVFHFPIFTHQLWRRS